MPISGIRKAAMLLTTLDPGTAAELLKSATPDTITEIAAELAYMDVSGGAGGQLSSEPIREFFGLLRKQKTDDGDNDFVRKMLESAVGQEQSQKMLGRVQELVQAKDPFLQIRSADVKVIGRALEGESAQVAAIVLSELPAKKSAELLGMLGDDIRPAALQSMAIADEVSLQARLRVASAVRSELEASRRGGVGVPEAEVEPTEDRRGQQMRKVAIVLRSLEKDFRDNLLAGLSQSDKETAQAVQEAMVLWEDMPMVADRPLQEILRQVNSKSLALALVDADENTVNKVRANMSERAGAMLEEEASLLSSPKPDEITAAREEILVTLRELNSKGELSFEES